MVRSYCSIVDVHTDALVNFGENPVDGPRRHFFFMTTILLVFYGLLDSLKHHHYVSKLLG